MHPIVPRGVFTFHRRGDEPFDGLSLQGVTLVHGVEVCKEMERRDGSEDAISLVNWSSKATNLRGQTLYPGICTPGYGVPSN